VNLSQLRYFCAVCKHQSVSRAAENLFVSQPSISVAIKNLEAELGVTLFFRGSNKMILTREGEIFLKKARTLLAHAENVVTDMRDLARRETHIRIGFPPILGSFFIPFFETSREALLKNHPHVTLEISEQELQELPNLLEKGILNLAIVNINRGSYPSLGKQTLYQLPMMLCVGPHHRLARKKIVSIEDYKDEPIITFKRSSVVAQDIVELYAKFGYTPNIQYIHSQGGTIESRLMRNDGITILVPGLAIRHPDIVRIPLKEPIINQVGAIWSRKVSQPGEIAAFLDTLRQFPIPLP